MDYPTDALPAAIYGGAQILCGLLLLAIWRYATGPRGFGPSKLDRSVVRSVSIRIALGPLLCLVAVAVSLADPHVGTLFFMMVPLLYVSNHKVDESWRAPTEDAETP